MISTPREFGIGPPKPDCGGSTPSVDANSPIELRQRSKDGAAKLIGRNVTAIQADAANLADLDRVTAAVKAEKGVVDIVVSNAGFTEQATIDAITPEHFDKAFNLMARGPVFLVQKLLRLMTGGGSIILVSSAMHLMGIPGHRGPGEHVPGHGSDRSTRSSRGDCQRGALPCFRPELVRDGYGSDGRWWHRSGLTPPHRRRFSMSYAIIGLGKIGTAIAQAFARQGMEVIVAGRRSLDARAAQIGASIVPGRVEDAIKADLVVLAVPFAAHQEIGRLAESWEGKVPKGRGRQPAGGGSCSCRATTPRPAPPWQPWSKGSASPRSSWGRSARVACSSRRRAARGADSFSRTWRSSTDRSKSEKESTTWAAALRDHIATSYGRAKAQGACFKDARAEPDPVDPVDTAPAGAGVTV